MPDEFTNGEPNPPAAREPDDPGRRLRESARRRDELLGALARELQLPLEAARTEVRALLSSEAGATARDALERIDRRLATLRDLQQDVAELQDLSVGRARLHRARADLAEIADRVADEVERALTDRGVALVRELPGVPVALAADPDRLRFALREIAASVAASAPRGALLALRIDALPGGGRVVLEIRPPDGAPPPLRPALSGTVSLALAREILDLHGAVLEATAGRAEVWVVEDVGEAVAHGPEAALAGRPRILIVEDDEPTREALAEALADAYDVEPAVDGVDGVEAARARRPDVVLMDIGLPRLDGFQALAALRGDPATADVPVILVSGDGDDLTRARSLDLGAFDFLPKPYSERELRARIERTLRLARRQSQLQVLAETDPLTGLANRRAFRTRLAQEVKRARRYGTPLACVMIDLDHLKPVNDEHGHAAGDRAIAALASVLRAELRETDLGARYGGDEFVALLPHTAAGEARALAERVAERLRHTEFDAGGTTLKLQASMGVAELGAGSPDDAAEALLGAADAALYRAKAAGRGRVEVHGIQ
jgi:diguanylate cyclase (GGDEF)-like protein